MGASARTVCNFSTLLSLEKPLLKTFPTNASFSSRFYRPPTISLPPVSVLSSNNYLRPAVSCDTHINNSFGFSNFPSFSHSSSAAASQFLLNSVLSSSNFAHILSGPKGEGFHWNYAENEDGRREFGVTGEKGPVVTSVLLGWLGANPKHLRRYAELYNARGIHAVTFVVSVRDVLSVDLGRKLQERIKRFARELISWLSESEKDGRERLLIFHTFSNTGWLAYGAILDNMLERPDLLEKIKGCIIDSGGDPNIDPKVWAAGFAAALLKKPSSSAYSLAQAGSKKLGGSSSISTTSKIQEKDPPYLEALFLSALEKLFSFLLNFPDANQRLCKIISILTNNQPICPQLYLYSRADKVIPYESIESFIQEQRRAGKTVKSFDFGSSPHVDHYRTFPDLYSLHLNEFLDECLIGLIEKNLVHKN